MPNDSTTKSPANANCNAGSTYFVCAKPIFTARTVAKVIGLKLGRKLAFAEGDEDVDGEVDVTKRVHVQVGADYLSVGAWIDDTTLRSWPARRNIPWAFRDLQEALKQYAEVI